MDPLSLSSHALCVLCCQTFLSDADLARALPAGSRLQVLRLAGCKNILTLNAMDYPSLRVIDVSRTKVKPTDVTKLLSRHGVLRVLFAERCFRHVRSLHLEHGALEVLSLKGSSFDESEDRVRVGGQSGYE
jgi:hypothetical protein